MKKINSAFFFTFILLQIIICNTVHSQISAEKSKSAYENIKSLVGEWKGDFEWTGAMTGKGKQIAKYYLTGANSTIVENLISEDGTVTMTSVYHMDGDDLRMTHYCAANNQPRLKATNSDQKLIEFEMLDITNLKHDKAGHVYGVKLKFLSPDELEINFKFRAGEKESLEIIRLARVN